MLTMNLDKLIEKLEACFPTKVHRSDPDREVWIKVGQQEVIDKLKSLAESEDIMNVHSVN